MGGGARRQRRGGRGYRTLRVLVVLAASLPTSWALVAVAADDAGVRAGDDAARTSGAEVGPAPRRKPHGHSVRPFHLSAGGGVFRPWDGNPGWNVSAMFHRGFGSDRFWVGGELEFRHFEANIKQDFRPDYDSYALRFQFQYHPFPRAIVSPYVGVGVGFLINTVEDRRTSGVPNDEVRSSVSGGSTLLGLAGIEVPVPFVPGLQLFGEGRLENASDFWQRKGGNFQMDQVGGLTGMAGLRVRFQ